MALPCSIEILVNDERGVLLIGFVHQDLIISGVRVLSLRRQLAYSRQEEAIFGACLVEIRKIYACLPLPVWFNNQYWIG